MICDSKFSQLHLTSPGSSIVHVLHIHLRILPHIMIQLNGLTVFQHINYISSLFSMYVMSTSTIPLTEVVFSYAYQTLTQTDCAAN